MGATKMTKKAKKAIRHLETIKEHCDFFLNGNPTLNQEFIELEEIIEELSLEKKEDHARLAKKLKTFWKRDEQVDKG
jgi:hypothetical protein